MKILMVALICISGVGAYEVQKISAHKAYVKGCSTTAKSFLSMLGVEAPEKGLNDLCSDIATKEGY